MADESSLTSRLSLDDLLRELSQHYATRLDTLRHGSDAALEESDRRINELEHEYLLRHPTREVSPQRLRPDQTSVRR
jgi:sugar-specific transcriptional regulator TrmB